MISQNDFEHDIKKYFNFLESEFKYIFVGTVANGNVYFDCEFQKNNKTVSISYEVIEDYLQIFIIESRKKILTEKTKYQKIENLKEVRKKYFSHINKQKFRMVKQYFSNYCTETKFQKKLLKNAESLFIYFKFVK